MSRRLSLWIACLALGGLVSCVRFLKGGKEAEAHKEQMLQECAALQERDIDFEEEREFGSAVGVRWVSEGGGLIDQSDAKSLHQQLNLIGKNLALQSSRPTLPWTFGVLKSPGINAVSGPGGYVFVSEGLLARLDDEAQLAGVLAHEIAHVNRKHALGAYKNFLVTECENAAGAEVRAVYARAGMDLLNEAAGSTVDDVTSKLLPFSWWQGLVHSTRFDFDGAGTEAIQALTEGAVARLTQEGFRKQDEFAADQEAVELMAAAGYSPEAYVAFLGKLPTKNLSTPHPSAADRQEKLREQLKRWRAQSPSDFTSPVDLSTTAVVPLRDELRAHVQGR
jgi:beta-barrel assembly-enhancing protease